MRNYLKSGFIGFLIGIVFAVIVLWNAAPGLILLEDESIFPFDESVRVFAQTARQKGWQIPAAHDLKETMSKSGKDVLDIMVLELYHPEYAYHIISRDKERIVSPFMPSRVAIYKKSDGRVYVSRMNTALLGKMMRGSVPDIMDIASVESEEIIGAILKRNDKKR